jgi:hypothetical protein
MTLNKQISHTEQQSKASVKKYMYPNISKLLTFCLVLILED